MTQPGWYPNPNGFGGHRYFDGQQWTIHNTPPVQHRQTVPIVQGPNHALHAVLTLFTFWFFGGWAWIWLIVALGNKRRVTYL